MKQKDLLFLIISAFIVVLAWIGFSIYHNSTTSTIPAQLNIQIIPIQPNFDTKTINNLKTREQVAPIYGAQQIVPVTPTPATSSLTPTPIAPTPTKQATSSGSVTPTASPSGTIPPGFGNISP